MVSVSVSRTFGTVIARPHWFAEARLGFEIESTVTTTTRQTLQCLLVHLTAIRAFPAFLTDTSAFRAKTMTRTSRMWTIYLLAEFAFVTSSTAALAVCALSVSIAVGYLAIVVVERALLTLPAWIALALAINVFTVRAAKYRADALAAILATESRIALAVTEHTLAFATTAIWTVVRHILGNYTDETDFFGFAVVVVKREKPLTRLHVVRHFFLYRRLLQDEL